MGYSSCKVCLDSLAKSHRRPNDFCALLTFPKSSIRLSVNPTTSKADFHFCKMVSTYLLTGIIFHLLLVSAQNDECYWRSNNTIIPEPGWFVCQNTEQTSGGARLCCFGDSECGEDSLCRMNGASGYTYFVGGCTDSTYNDTICSKSCSSKYLPKTYVETTSD